MQKILPKKIAENIAKKVLKIDCKYHNKQQILVLDHIYAFCYNIKKCIKKIKEHLSIERKIS